MCACWPSLSLVVYLIPKDQSPSAAICIVLHSRRNIQRHVQRAPFLAKSAVHIVRVGKPNTVFSIGVGLCKPGTILCEIVTPGLFCAVGVTVDALTGLSGQ